jgi:hypothetical protein
MMIGIYSKGRGIPIARSDRNSDAAAREWSEQGKASSTPIANYTAGSSRSRVLGRPPNLDHPRPLRVHPASAAVDWIKQRRRVPLTSPSAKATDTVW